MHSVRSAGAIATVLCAHRTVPERHGKAGPLATNAQLGSADAACNEPSVRALLAQADGQAGEEVGRWVRRLKAAKGRPWS